MSLISILLLAGAMFLLAVTPGPGVLATVARALASGFRPAAAVVLGIVIPVVFPLIVASLDHNQLSELYVVRAELEGMGRAAQEEHGPGAGQGAEARLPLRRRPREGPLDRLVLVDQGTGAVEQGAAALGDGLLLRLDRLGLLRHLLLVGGEVLLHARRVVRNWSAGLLSPRPRPASASGALRKWANALPRASRWRRSAPAARSGPKAWVVAAHMGLGHQRAAFPLRDMVVYPPMMAPFVVGRRPSVVALERALARSDKRIFLATQRDPKVDEPGADDIYPLGVVARVVQHLQLASGNIKVMVEGLSRARLVDIERDALSFMRVHVPEGLDKAR